MLSHNIEKIENFLKQNLDNFEIFFKGIRNAIQRDFQYSNRISKISHLNQKSYNTYLTKHILKTNIILK